MATPEGKIKSYPIPKGSLEKVTKDQIKKYFKDNNIWYKMPQPGTYGGNTGTSDFQALHKGLFIAVEAKRNSPSAKLTPQQSDYLDCVNANGGLGVVISCEADLMSLDLVLKYRELI